MVTSGFCGVCFIAIVNNVGGCMISFISMTRKNQESPMGWVIGEMRLAARVDQQVGSASNCVIF